MTQLSRSVGLVLGGFLAILQLPASAVITKPQSKPIPAHATKGVSQMPGGYGAFGQTYTISDNGSLINYTIVSAEYSIDTFNANAGDKFAVDVDHKHLVIHFRIKNANTEDLYYSSNSGLFQAVDANDNTYSDSGYTRRESEKDLISTTLKPGQGIDDLETYIIVPSKGPIPKLILQKQVAGTNYQVIRFNLGTAPNLVKPLPALYADPIDSTGATSLATIPGTVGTAYNAGHFTMSLDSVALASGPFGNTVADDGKQFLVATVTITLAEWGSQYSSDNIEPTLVTADDKLTDHILLKAHSDEDFEGRTLDSGETATQRILIQVAKQEPLKTLSLVYDMGNDGKSRAYTYDVSSLKPTQ